MKKFLKSFAIVLFLFVIVNACSYEQDNLNDQDYITRFGFPFPMHDQAGSFLPAAFWRDVAVGLLVSFSVGLIYSTVTMLLPRKSPQQTQQA